MAVIECIKSVYEDTLAAVGHWIHLI